MKSLLFILFISSMALCGEVKARMQMPEALMDVMMAVVDSSGDLPEGPHWRVISRKLNPAACSDVDSARVLAVIGNGIESLASFYVDEELPYEKAIFELEVLAASELFLVCEDNILLAPFGLQVQMPELSSSGFFN